MKLKKLEVEEILSRRNLKLKKFEVEEIILGLDINQLDGQMAKTKFIGPYDSQGQCEKKTLGFKH